MLISVSMSFMKVLVNTQDQIHHGLGCMNFYGRTMFDHS